MQPDRPVEEGSEAEADGGRQGVDPLNDPETARRSFGDFAASEETDADEGDAAEQAPPSWERSSLEPGEEKEHVPEPSLHSEPEEELPESEVEEPQEPEVEPQEPEVEPEVPQRSSASYEPKPPEEDPKVSEDPHQTQAYEPFKSADDPLRPQSPPRRVASSTEMATQQVPLPNPTPPVTAIPRPTGHIPRSPQPTRRTPIPSQPIRGGPRRVKATLRRVDPWTILKFSLLFFTSVGLVFVFTVMMLFFAAEGMGIVGNIESFIQGIGWPGWEIRTAGVLRWLLVIAAVNVLALSAINLVIVFLYNLVSDVVGGIEVTMSQRDL
jgi:hypothetical protein